MKWHQSMPNTGQSRVRRVFAMLPIRCMSGEVAWLEHVRVLQEYWDGDWHDMMFVSETYEKIVDSLRQDCGW